ncbi:hypothetical protein [Merismopedia glauca]|uniref:hypothetical protein n=1 Tax=Merismopedia glauca TaxID=292586 RepID=UPI0011B28497|nr:hypothetical protein [Merismopedia glauca]
MAYCLPTESYLTQISTNFTLLNVDDHGEIACKNLNLKPPLSNVAIAVSTLIIMVCLFGTIGDR